MTTSNSIADVCIDIDETEQLLPPPSTSSLSTIHQIDISQEEEHHRCSYYEPGQQNDFEKDCAYNLIHQYEHWKLNGWGKSPICIPDALEVNGKWFIRTLDPCAAGFGKRAVAKKEAKIKGDIAEQAVHKAFQISTIGGMLIHGLDFASLWNKLYKPSMGISEEIILSLKPLADEESFEIDFLFFHPVYGITVMECKAFDIEKRTGRTAYSNALRQLERNVQKLFELFRILIGCECPPEFVHYLLCIPNSKKSAIEKSEQINILDKNDLEDNVAFEAFWKERSAHMEHQGGCFTNENICRFMAIIFGFRSVLFTSFCRNALEIHRMVDSHESSRHTNRSLTFTTNVTDQHSINGKKIIFLNSEQISAYERAKCVSNLCLFGPPGCGKTLLIMNLAKESTELEKPGRVVVILHYPELIEMYCNFFAANKNNQKRTIVINPSAKELKSSLADDSVDDIFADEVLYGGWINPKAKRKNGQIIIGVTIGRNYDKDSVTAARENLLGRLRYADVSFFELTTVMRNTGNICEYYKRFNPDNQIIIGHNIRGRNVKEYDTRNIDSACSLIVDHIKQYLNTSDCTANDIAVLIAHEPIISQTEKVKRSLKKAGIKVGSVVEQLQANNTPKESLVAVDCSANVLSCEWPIVFVIDATECPFSKSVANPIVACSRAVSSLFVINTRDCQYPYFKYFCKKFFASMLYAKQRQVSDFHLHEIICEKNMNPFHRRLFRSFFVIQSFFLFVVGPILLFIDLYLLRSRVRFNTSNVTKNYMYESGSTENNNIAIDRGIAKLLFSVYLPSYLEILEFHFRIIAVLCIYSFIISFRYKFQDEMRGVLNVLCVLSAIALILMFVMNENAIAHIIVAVVITLFYIGLNIILSLYYKLHPERIKVYVLRSSSLLSVLRIFVEHQIINLLFIIIIPSSIVFSAIYNEYISLAVSQLFMLLCSPWLYDSLKLPLSSKFLNHIIIYPPA